jgi:hypothetical protein
MLSYSRYRQVQGPQQLALLPHPSRQQELLITPPPQAYQRCPSLNQLIHRLLLARVALGVWLTMYAVLPTAFRTTSQSHAPVVAPVDVGPRLPACANPALCVSALAAIIR